MKKLSYFDKCKIVAYSLLFAIFTAGTAEIAALNRDPVGFNLNSIEIKKIKYLALMAVEIDEHGKTVVKKTLPILGDGKYTESDISKNLPVNIDYMETFYEKPKINIVVFVSEKNGKDIWNSNETRIIPIDSLQSLLIKRANNEEIGLSNNGPIDRYLAREFIRNALKANGWTPRVEKQILDQFFNEQTSAMERTCLLDMFAKFVDSVSDFETLRTILANANADDPVILRTAYIMLLLAIVKDSKYASKVGDSMLKTIKEHCFWWNEKSLRAASFGERAIFFARSYMLLSTVSQKYNEFYKK